LRRGFGDMKVRMDRQISISDKMTKAVSAGNEKGKGRRFVSTSKQAKKKDGQEAEGPSWVIGNKEKLTGKWEKDLVAFLTF